MSRSRDKTGGFSYLDDKSLEVRFDTCTSVEGLARVLFAIARGRLRKYRHPRITVSVLPATEEETDLSGDVSYPTLADETDLVVTDMFSWSKGHWPPIKVGGRNRETVWDDPKLRKKAYDLGYVTALRLAHENPRLSQIPDQDPSSQRGVLSLLKWCIENIHEKMKPGSEDKNSRKKGGRKAQHDMKFWQRVRDTYEEHLTPDIGSKGAWSKAAEVHGLASGDAARMQCYRHLNPKRNSEQR